MEKPRKKMKKHEENGRKTRGKKRRSKEGDLRRQWQEGTMDKAAKYKGKH